MRRDEYREAKKKNDGKEGVKGKKLVEELLVWQMSERWELTPHFKFFIFIIAMTDVQVNTKLCEHGKVNGNGYILHKVAQLVAYITVSGEVLKAQSSSSKWPI